MRKSLIILPCIALLSPFSVFAGGEGDNSIARQIQYRDYNYLHNVANGSLNPVSVSLMPLHELATVGAGYRWDQGGYHRVDQSGHSDALTVGAYGIKRLERLAFEGGLTYFNENDRSKCWNSTLFQSKLNPFVLADSSPSDYNTERFNVNGRVAYDLTPAFRFGINADYNVGVMSDEKDPRVETKGMRFVINPGVQWDASSHFSLGATGGLNLFNESLRYTCVSTAVNFPFYAMSGMGTFYPQSGSSYSRDSKGTSWFAGADVTYNSGAGIADYLSVIYSHENESATDGGSTYQFKAGDYMNDVLRVHNRLSIIRGRIAHNVEIGAELNNVKGKWYDQKAVTINGTTHYEVMGSSVKHKETRTEASVAYRFDMLDRHGVSGFTAGVSARYMMSDTKNFPELYFQKYSRLAVLANVSKHFNIKKVRMGVGIDGGYGMCLTASHDFSGLELEHEYTMPLYGYLTSDSFSIGGRVDASLPVRDFIIGLYVGGGTTRCVGGKTDMYKDENLSSVNCGLTFAF